MSRDIKYIGMDVHKEATVIAVLNANGNLVMESIVETKAGQIQRRGHRPCVGPFRNYDAGMGQRGKDHARRRRCRIYGMGKTPYCLGLTKHGFPKHPLHQAYATPLVPYIGRFAHRQDVSLAIHPGVSKVVYENTVFPSEFKKMITQLDLRPVKGKDNTIELVPALEQRANAVLFNGAVYMETPFTNATRSIRRSRPSCSWACRT